ncbi:MAG TPA: L-2-hydroxyglutarate oxidase [Planctomycetaceae bacterium]|jgi:L-2-hydroxyglutarate oxidase|nr:L-2-hydroxyglutarate oxidase [Planctomycetaceae bacterium]|tara:strand:- start:887 stop:2086 length:1200 start_codon:yes stop_codon:yes gene_type:complete
MADVDLVIAGGGIVGLATAYRFLERFPERRVTVLEKEANVAEHQTGHNSGVLHSGIYYKPGSLKAENCRAGKLAMEEFCEEHNIPFERCGKVIVAVDESELPALERIYERGLANGVACEMIGVERLGELEPHAAGIRAIHVPESGIVDYREVCRTLARLIVDRGADLRFDSRIFGIEHESDSVVVETTTGTVTGELLVNCTGLQCDRVTRLGGVEPEAKIVPFRGEYFELKPEAQSLCRNLIYPTPDPKFPFLGVHFTRMIHGGVECGPNAVLAFAREGYRKRDINLRDLCESLTYIGFLRMASRHWRTGMGEMWRSFSKRAFVKALSRLLPDIRCEHLEPAPAGVRAQALSTDGTLVDDFLVQSHGRVVNVGNAPSPAATASLNVGRLVVGRLAERFE